MRRRGKINMIGKKRREKERKDKKRREREKMEAMGNDSRI